MGSGHGYGIWDVLGGGEGVLIVRKWGVCGWSGHGGLNNFDTNGGCSGMRV